MTEPLSYAEETRARVSVGAKLLDARQEGWFRKIDIGALDIVSMERCVLGQLYGSYHAGMRALEIDYGIDYGFNAPGASSTALVAWFDEIDARLVM